MSHVKRHYKVIDAFSIRGSTALILDNKREEAVFGTNNILTEGNELIPYSLTHNENTIIVKGNKSLIGQQISFC